MPVDVSIFKNALPYRAFHDTDWVILSKIFKETHFKSGAVVFKEHDKGDGFYCIRSGKVRISRQVVPEGGDKAQEQLLTLLTEGNIFGEMALVDNAHRSADATTEGDTVLYHMTMADYKKLKNDEPVTALKIQDLIARILCARMREANRSFEVIYFLFS